MPCPCAGGGCLRGRETASSSEEQRRPSQLQPRSIGASLSQPSAAVSPRPAGPGTPIGKRQCKSVIILYTFGPIEVRNSYKQVAIMSNVAVNTVKRIIKAFENDEPYALG